MIFSKNKKQDERLLASYGKPKDDEVFDFEIINRYFEYQRPDEAFQVLSDKTCNDLDLESLFMFIDRTTSKIGQQFLYSRLRTIRKKDASGELHEKIIARLDSDSGFRLSVQKQLNGLKHPNAWYISSLLNDEHIRPPRWFFLAKVFSFAAILSLILSFFVPEFIFVIIAVFVVNIGIHYLNKSNLGPYLVSLPQLLRLSRVASALYKSDLLSPLGPGLPKAIKSLNKIKNRLLFFRFESGMQGEFEAIVWAITELVKIFFLAEPLLFFAVLKRLDQKRKDIEVLFRFVGLTDTLLSIASLRSGLPYYCRPEITEKPQKISAKAMYHPLVSNCVGNDISVDRKSVLLTGSNMSGKTTFIRSTGINVITGLTLNTCFARAFSMPVMKIFSAIRISDDLLNDRSYYFEEVLTIKTMIEESSGHDPCLFLLDEIFKGTNTVERISAGKAVLSYLAKPENLVFVSTHDIELADLLISEYDLYHFSEKVDDRNVDFDYKLKSGKLKNRNAIRILQLNGYPGEVIDEAIKLSSRFDPSSETKPE